jgi:sugar/nucleoside kinase (ribokinase family)
MSNNNPFCLISPRPSCMGTGLIALDVVINEADEGKASLWAGGSCGNVLTALSYLGWLAYPIANHRNDSASEKILEDMKRWGVNTQFIYRSEKGVTPIVIEKLHSLGSSASHEFKFVCPICGTRLPRNRPISLDLVSKVQQEMVPVKVFYFDRVSKAALALAREQKTRGALIVFEPVIMSQEALFRQCLELAHIVKYSGEQINISRFKCDIPLEIQTLGSKGLRYKQSFGRSERKWLSLSPFNVPSVVDSAGAGDWCTVGLIHCLGQEGAEGFSRASEGTIKTALLFGEALAALKCRYKGARGMMYNISRNEFESLTCGILEGKNLNFQSSPISQDSESSTVKYICSACK